jgi:alpha-ketoglutarate-dependent taurine dioxygenase
MRVEDLTPVIGSEIRADVNTLLNGDCVAQIRELLAARGVLVFRGLNFDDDQQKRFSERLGELSVQRDREFMSISLDKRIDPNAEYLRGTIYWHIDMMLFKAPNLATLLTARRLSDVGGETEFANTYAAWEALSEAERREYENLRVWHTMEASQIMTTPEPSLQELEHWRTFPSALQPLVWTHCSGRKSLLLGASASHVEGKGVEESRYILTKLRTWATQPRFVYQHKWQVGDLLIWDNTGTMHRVLPYAADSGRLMRRTVLKGEEQIA